jgi:hypothetical protein
VENLQKGKQPSNFALKHRTNGIIPAVMVQMMADPSPESRELNSISYPQHWHIFSALFFFTFSVFMVRIRSDPEHFGLVRSGIIFLDPDPNEEQDPIFFSIKGRYSLIAILYALKRAQNRPQLQIKRQIEKLRKAMKVMLQLH